MINSKYQIIILGENKELLPSVLSKLENVLHDMQITNNYQIVYSDAFNECSLGINPTVALYFTNETGSDKDCDVVSILKKHSVVIIPIIDSFDNASRLLPEALRKSMQQE